MLFYFEKGSNKSQILKFANFEDIFKAYNSKTRQISIIQWVKHITTCIKEIDRMQIFKPFTPVVRASQGAQTHPLVHSFLNIFPIIFLNRIFFYRYLSTVKTAAYQTQ